MFYLQSEESVMVVKRKKRARLPDSVSVNYLCSLFFFLLCFFSYTWINVFPSEPLKCFLKGNE